LSFRRFIFFMFFSYCASSLRPATSLLAYTTAPAYPTPFHTACSSPQPNSTTPYNAASHSVSSPHYQCSARTSFPVSTTTVSTTQSIRRTRCSGFSALCFMTGTRPEVFLLTRFRRCSVSACPRMFASFSTLSCCSPSPKTTVYPSVV
jgi:hypothetical protein